MNTERLSGKEYITPNFAIVDLFSEGLLCLSLNEIEDLDYYYDENEKE